MTELIHHHELRKSGALEVASYEPEAITNFVESIVGICSCVCVARGSGITSSLGIFVSADRLRMIVGVLLHMLLRCCVSAVGEALF